MTLDVLYRSEVLFYVQNNAASEADDDLVATLMFFTDEELTAAKNAIYAVAANDTGILPESLPRLRIRRGEKKRESDAGDIIELWRALDAAKAELPLFVAADQKRIPPVTVSGSDLSVMSTNMIEMRTQLKQMAAAQKQLADTVNKMQLKMMTMPEQIAERVGSTAEFPVLGAKPIDGQTKSLQPLSSSINIGTGSSDLSPTVSNTWSDLVEAVAAAGGLQKPTLKPAKPTSPKVIRGMKDVSSGPKGVPRRLTAFVGRLDLNTTEEDLKQYLLDAGIIDPYCKKLAAKDNRKFRTAAFMVSCDSSCKTAFHDESIWPAGCELRDWVFYKKPLTTSAPPAT